MGDQPSKRGGKRPGAGRKPKYQSGNTREISIRLPPAAIEKIDADAARLGISRSEAIARRLLRIRA